MKPRIVEKPSDRRTEKQQFAMAIGKHLRSVREQRGISQENLSLKAGYYRTYVGKIEQGLYSPSSHTIWRLAHALDMNLTEFFEKF